MEESHLHLLVAVFHLSEEDHASLMASTVHTLNEPTAFLDAVVVPLDLKHPPVLLDVYRCHSLPITPLLCIANNKSVLDIKFINLLC